MAETATKLEIHQGDKFDPAKLFADRESRELVIAFAGPVGCGLNDVIETTKQIVQEFGYTVVQVKVSDFIRKLAKLSIASEEKAKRYLELQLQGSELRKQYSNDILAKCISTRIATVRKAEIKGTENKEGSPPEKVVYIIDQLKHPDEVEFLRVVYRNLFYLIGVLSSEERRKKRLVDEPMEEQDAVSIMKCDKDEGVSHGQQLEDTLQLADLFLRNSSQNRLNIEEQVKRFLELLHGKIGITPSQHEYAMYIAHSAAQKSGCLSRQVGAAITDESGHIISTGCNDVPKSGGGLYTEADKLNDHRCLQKGNKCYNDHHKDLLRDEIKQILVDTEIKQNNENNVLETYKINKESAQFLANKIKKTTKLKDLIEYSRSVHAEMDAITSAARNGAIGIQDGYLYSTTFPCHNCARHILASGVKRVYYIEPYEKSLAYTLHDDAITIDPDNEDTELSRVSFFHFEGISPRRFLAFFHTGLRRKEKGHALPFYKTEAKKVAPQYIDSYLDFEKKVIEDIAELGLKNAIIE